ncbi:MAG: hypothetical protein AAFV95_17400 [Bacteroidota bacterium]
MDNQTHKLLKKIEREKQKREEIERTGRRDKEPNLLNLSDALDEFYFLSKLKNYCAYLSYTRFTNPNLTHYDKKDFRLMREILREVDLDDFDNPVLRIYNRIRLLFEACELGLSTDEDIYNEVVEILDETDGCISFEEEIEFHSYLCNYAIDKVNRNKNSFKKRLLFHYVKALDKTYQIPSNSGVPLPPATYKNVVKTALFSGEDTVFFQSLQLIGVQPSGTHKSIGSTYEWIENFIHYYKKKMDGDHRESYHTYCEALLYFEYKKFGRAYRTLGNPLHLQGMFINLDIRLLHLMVLYELFNRRPTILENDDIEILKILDNFRHQLRDDENRKHQISSQYLELFKQFAKLYRRLYQLNIKVGGMERKLPKFVRAIEELILDVLNKTPPYKHWLLEKAKEL